MTAMKKMVFLIALTVLAFTGCATQQRAEKREQMRKAVAEAVAKRQLHIDIMSMNTMRYGTRTVSPDFFLELRGDTLHSYLPYLGQAHQAPMLTPSQGLNFETTVQALRESRPKSHLTRIEMDVRTIEDFYQYVVELFDTGKTCIHVTSMHRDPISFDGELIPEP